MEQLTKNQAVATSQEAVQNQNEPQLRDENAHNDKSVHGVLNPTYQAGLRRDAVQPDIEAERKKRDEIEAGKSYCSRRFGGATCDDKSAQIYARFDKNDWRIQPAEFYRSAHKFEQICRHRLDRKSGSAGMPRPISYAVFCLKKKTIDIPRTQGALAKGTVLKEQPRPRPGGMYSVTSSYPGEKPRVRPNLSEC